jgi:N-methylhydantoinase B
MRRARGSEIPLFNYGPGIEELRTNAKAETGLNAPRPPVRQPSDAVDLAIAAE